MQLGTRWRRGAEPPRAVPQQLRAEIARHEHAHPDAAAWTLTWLEGRPRLQLIADCTLTTDAAGAPRWEVADRARANGRGPEAGAAPGAALSGGASNPADADDDDDDDDDDWLRDEGTPR